MNIFYAPPSHIREKSIELRGQEARHASKALRYKQGDRIAVVDGTGGWYEGRVQTISDETVRIAVEKESPKVKVQPQTVLSVGIIKKRDRLEFAVEKAVELGVKEIALFRGEHSVKQNVRLDRLDAIALSAMKQSLRAWLPEVKVYEHVREVVQSHPNSNFVTAHQDGPPLEEISNRQSNGSTLLMVGPEGGFSNSEIAFFQKKKTDFVSLGNSRLRTETAAITLLSCYNASLSC